LIGSFAAVVLLIVKANGSTASSRFFRRDEAKIWIAVVAAQAGFWAVAARYVWPRAAKYLPQGLRDLLGRGSEAPKHPPPSLRDFGKRGASVALLFVLLIGVPLIARLTAGNVNPLWGSDWKTMILSAAAFIAVALPSFIGILGVQVVCLDLGRTIEDEDIEDFIGLRDELNRFLGLLGAVIGLAVLAAGTLRNAVLAADPNADFPALAILEYAAFLTLLLAFVYVPAHKDLLRWGRRIRDDLLAPRPNPRSETFRDWYGKRKDLGELLEIDVTTFQRLQSAVFILSPLITAALSLAIPKTD